MEFKSILYQVADGVATLTLNRPQRRNAFTDLMMMEIVQALADADADPQVRALIITGAGDRAFCPGMDLRGRSEDPAQWPAEATAQLPGQPFGWFGKILTDLRDVGKPTICAVNGVASGGGFSLTLACDFRIASQSARFTAIFLDRGLMAMGMTYLLPRIVGIENALHILYTSRMFSAEEALHLGLVGRVVPSGELMDSARALAAELVKAPALAVKLTRRAVYRGLDNDFHQHLAYEAWAQSMCAATQDAKEGRAAFLEKRAPVFKRP
ncbi:MAG: enoyl-CoA hydratase/isomerase family protein [Chloroflexi bacterium]|nr:enoyl-CoA hydratase/isomerase family protein [Chloroflexota bacterium]